MVDPRDVVVGCIRMAGRLAQIELATDIYWVGSTRALHWITIRRIVILYGALFLFVLTLFGEASYSKNRIV